MSKTLRKFAVVALSTSMLSSVFLTSQAHSILAQEVNSMETSQESEESATDEETTESEVSRREQDSENPYTEAEIAEYIQPTVEYDVNFVYSVDELQTFFDEITATMTDSESGVTEEELLEMAPDPSNTSETGDSGFYTWVAIEDDQVVVIESQTYDEGDGRIVSNITQSYRTPKMFLPLSLSEEELLSIYEGGTLEELISLLGEPEMLTYYDYTPNAIYYWGVAGEAEIEPTDLVAVEVEVSPEGELLQVSYGTAEDMMGESDESGQSGPEESSEETTTEETTSEEEMSSEESSE